MDRLVRQFELALAHKGEKIACLEMRKHLAWYLKGVPYASYWNSTQLMGPLSQPSRNLTVTGFPAAPRTTAAATRAALSGSRIATP